MPAPIEYRSFEMAPLEEESTVVEGYATTFDRSYELWPGMNECIRSTALDGADMSDVIFLLNHEGMPLARQRNGTLSIERDAHGLKATADLSGCQDGRDVLEAIRNGLIDRMSWAFTVADDGWEYDKETKTAYINKIDRVFDVSAVSRPANEGTEIHARSYLDALGEQDVEEAREGREERARLAALISMAKGV